MEKKKMTNKKKFWIGMSSLAAVGIITATVAYFSSVHVFENDTLKSLGYGVKVTKLLDSGAIQDMASDRRVNADVTVENTGDGPILTRITYYWQNNLSDMPTAIDLGSNYLTNNGWTFTVTGANFVKGNDNSYYYKGIIEKNGTVQHLDEISYSGAESYSGSTKYTDKSNPTTEEDWKSVDELVSSSKGERQTYSFGSPTEGYLTVVVETIQATKADGAALNSEDINAGSSADSVANLWHNLGKGNPVIPGGGE